MQKEDARSRLIGHAEALEANADAQRRISGESAPLYFEAIQMWGVLGRPDKVTGVAEKSGSALVKLEAVHITEMARGKEAAARLSERLEMPDVAVSLYLDAKMYDAAGRVALNAGMTDRLDAIETRKLHDSTRMAGDFGMHGEAATLRRTLIELDPKQAARLDEHAELEKRLKGALDAGNMKELDAVVKSMQERR